ncbi:MAG: 4Fe-4S cluster-binding domain-containing protein [Bacteroidetes bacterium]|nr:4Fe-4S cluster-binding domain-containing protein [Bacteroidota bacterium]
MLTNGLNHNSKPPEGVGGFKSHRGGFRRLFFASYDIVFQEIPNEITLALNISGCPNRCKGCHSPHLQTDCGEELTEEVIENLLHNYGNAITCVCFMGGDQAPETVLHFAQFVRRGVPMCAPCNEQCAPNNGQTHKPNNGQTQGQTHRSAPTIKTAWYSGKSEIHPNAMRFFDYIKIGDYREELGGLQSPATNQRLYKIENEKLLDVMPIAS